MTGLVTGFMTEFVTGFMAKFVTEFLTGFMTGIMTGFMTVMMSWCHVVSIVYLMDVLRNTGRMDLAHRTCTQELTRSSFHSRWTLADNLNLKISHLGA